MMNIPIIKLEIEGMREQINIALATYHEELAQSVNVQLEAVIKEFDFSHLIKNVTQRAIEDTVKRAIEYYFSAGNGRIEIDAAVSKLFDKPATSEPTSSDGETLLRQQITRMKTLIHGGNATNSTADLLDHVAEKLIELGEDEQTDYVVACKVRAMFLRELLKGE